MPKACLVAGVASLTYLNLFNVILIQPSCPKKDFAAIVSLYREISQGLMEKNGAPSTNCRTDGDGTRRQATNSLMSFPLNLESPFGEIISMLRLMDLLAGELNETSSFHVKHLLKRC